MRGSIASIQKDPTIPSGATILNRTYEYPHLPYNNKVIIWQDQST